MPYNGVSCIMGLIRRTGVLVDTKSLGLVDGHFDQWESKSQRTLSVVYFPRLSIPYRRATLTIKILDKMRNRKLQNQHALFHNFVDLAI